MTVPVAAMPTWTRTLNERDAYVLLDLAEPGESLAAWRARCDPRLPQASHARRRELLREVERDLLDHDGAVLTSSAFLTLFQRGGPFLRQGLFLGRALMTRPGIHLALDALVLPAVARAEEPLALPEDGHIPGAAWEDWLHAHLPPGTGVAASDKTRQTLQRHLQLAGVFVPDDPASADDAGGDGAPGAKGSTGATGGTARRASPAPLAFAWTVAWELRRQGRGEASLDWALRASFAARLWATDDAYGRAAVDEGVAAGLLTRSYLAGEPRVHPAGRAP